MKKIALNKETIRNLTSLELDKAAGGLAITMLDCHISTPGKCVTKGGQCESAITMPC